MGYSGSGTAGWWQEKRERSYLFIDGGHLRAMCRDVFSRLFHTDKAKIDFAKVLSQMPCSKAFYYDCIVSCPRNK